MNKSFDDPKFLLTVAGVVIAAIVVVIAVSRLTSGRPSASGTLTDRDHCPIARKALEAFDQGRPPPVEWIQDREAAKNAVRACERR